MNKIYDLLSITFHSSSRLLIDYSYKKLSFLFEVW